MASFGIEERKEDNTLDPMEPVMSMKRGINSVPWHPGTMGPPFVYKVTLLGACGAGKSAVAHRLVAHTFDPTYRATRQPQQLFWRHTEASTGRDILVEIEDCPGVTPETSESGELSTRGRYEITQLLNRSSGSKSTERTRTRRARRPRPRPIPCCRAARPRSRRPRGPAKEGERAAAWAAWATR